MAKLTMQEEASAPSTPGVGKWVAYFKSSGLHIKDDAGNEIGPIEASNILLTTGGTFTAYTITTIGDAALVTGETFRIKFHATAGTSPTLNRDAKGAKSLKYYDATGTKQNATSTQIIANMILTIIYDGTDYVILGGGSSGGGGSVNGWNSGTGTWSYVSADSPSFVCNVPDADAALFSVGARFSLTQTTEKFFIVTAKGSPSGGYTPCTIYGGTDYTLANAAITSPKWSNVKAPYGFPLGPAKWTVTVTDTESKQKTSPVQNTWYGGANAWTTGTNVTISLPIGTWRVMYSLYQYVLDSSATLATMETTLSSSNNSESDEELTGSHGINGASGTLTSRQTSRCEANITVASKTTYYLLARSESSGMDDINIVGALRATIIKAECAFL